MAVYCWVYDERYAVCLLRKLKIALPPGDSLLGVSSAFNTFV